MQKDYRKEISFQAGEISPRFYGRSETEFYQKGLAEATNVFVERRGGIFRRGGLLHIGAFDGNDARVFTKQINRFRFDTILIREGELVVIAPGAGFLSPNLIANANFNNGSASWSVTVDPIDESRVVFGNGFCRLLPEVDSVVPQATDFAQIAQQCTVTGSQTEDHFLVINQATNSPYHVLIGTTEGAGDILDTYGGETTENFTFVPNSGTYWVSIRAEGVLSEENIITFVGSVTLANSGGVGLNMPAPWTEDQLPLIHVVEEPDGEGLYFFHPNVQPQKLVYDFGTDIYTTLAPVSFTSAPGGWSGDNWPATGAIFQGRLWVGGTPNKPQSFYASVSGSPEDFTFTGGQDSSSFTLTLQKFGRIKWMLGTKVMVIGTENGEHVVTSEGPVITQTDFDIEQQSAYGSNDMQALQVGEKVFYTTPDGRRIQSMAYEWQENNWLSQDLMFASEHLSAGVIEQRAWAQNPNSAMLFTLESGDLIILTYDRTSETVGWTFNRFDGFEVADIGVGTINGTSRLVLVGQRTTGKMDIEVSGPNSVYLDSYNEQYYEPAQTVLDGLDHLEGQTVQVLVDGAVEPSKVVTGGQITTERAGNRIAAGIQIKSKVVTLAPDVPGGQDSIRSWVKRWNKVWALLFDSAAPIINGVRPPDRSPSTPMDTPEPFRSGHFKTVSLGHDEFGQITIEEDLPVPMNLLAIYGEMGRDTL